MTFLALNIRQLVLAVVSVSLFMILVLIFSLSREQGGQIVYLAETTASLPAFGAPAPPPCLAATPTVRTPPPAAMVPEPEMDEGEEVPSEPAPDECFKTTEELMPGEERTLAFGFSPILDQACEACDSEINDEAECYLIDNPYFDPPDPQMTAGILLADPAQWTEEQLDDAPKACCMPNVTCTDCVNPDSCGFAFCPNLVAPGAMGCLMGMNMALAPTAFPGSAMCDAGTIAQIPQSKRAGNPLFAQLVDEETCEPTLENPCNQDYYLESNSHLEVQVYRYNERPEIDLAFPLSVTLMFGATDPTPGEPVTFTFDWQGSQLTLFPDGFVGPGNATCSHNALQQSMTCTMPFLPNATIPMSILFNLTDDLPVTSYVQPLSFTVGSPGHELTFDLDTDYGCAEPEYTYPTAAECGCSGTCCDDLPTYSDFWTLHLPMDMPVGGTVTGPSWLNETTSGRELILDGADKNGQPHPRLLPGESFTLNNLDIAFTNETPAATWEMWQEEEIQFQVKHPAYQSWLSYIPEGVNEINPPETRSYDFTITPPADAAPGVHKFTVFVVAHVNASNQATTPKIDLLLTQIDVEVHVSCGTPVPPCGDPLSLGCGEGFCCNTDLQECTQNTTLCGECDCQPGYECDADGICTAASSSSSNSSSSQSSSPTFEDPGLYSCPLY